MENIKTTDITVFTNKDRVKVLDRMKTLLDHAEFFDCLVGYFRITGFYLLKEELEKVKEIRFLIGLGIDKKSANAYSETLFDIDTTIRNNLSSKIRNEFDLEEDGKNIEDGVNVFVEWIKSGKIKIRACKDQNVHAKVYIIRNDDTIREHQFGNVVTGSSNFSYNGLEKNIEFNVELKDPEKVKYSLDFFNELWNDSIDITEIVDDIIQNETWFNKEITPYELYLKTLYSYFEEELEDDKVNIEKPKGFLDLKYQEHAVIQARKILKKHGGVIIADVVGLGKTYIAAMLLKTLEENSKSIFIVPPIIEKYWNEVLDDFNCSRNTKVMSWGKIADFAKSKEYEEYKYVFVDEAHLFRNKDSTRYQNLKEICHNKKVILLTATPQNNYISDIYNLICLFQDEKKSSIICGQPDLRAFFKDLESELKHSKNKIDERMVFDDVMIKIRDYVLKNIMVRRTRSEILKYYADDLKKQNITFPKLHDPEPLTYTYNDKVENIFNETIELLKKLKYARYSPLLYVKPEFQSKLVGDRKSGQENIKGFISSILIKRLESSIYSFTNTIQKIRNNMIEFYKLFKMGRITVGTNSKNFKIELSELLDVTDDEFDDLIVHKKLKTVKVEELVDHYKDYLENDLEIFNKLCDLWANSDYDKDDNKIATLVDLIKKCRVNACKIIIFSESKDTVKYVEEKLKNFFGNTVISFCGSDTNAKREIIENNFDPKKEKVANDFDILVTTDRLSEGINLHRASVIVNYDLPWNPTRVMQRVGRINRIGSKFSDLYVYNFFPTENTREHLSLEETIKRKIDMFHSLIGDDTKYITGGEEVKPNEFFDLLMMKNFKFEDDDEKFKLNSSHYLSIISDIKDKNPELFEKIKLLPNKIKTARCGQNSNLISFIKKGSYKEFICTDNNETSFINFDKAIDLLKCDESEKNLEVPRNFYDLLDSNKKQFNDKINDLISSFGISKGESKNIKNLTKILGWLTKNKNALKDDDYMLIFDVQGLVDRGIINNNLAKKITQKVQPLLNKNKLSEVVKCIKDNIPRTFFSSRTNYELNFVLDNKETVILSEYFVKEK